MESLGPDFACVHLPFYAGASWQVAGDVVGSPACWRGAAMSHRSMLAAAAVISVSAATTRLAAGASKRGRAGGAGGGAHLSLTCVRLPFPSCSRFNQRCDNRGTCDSASHLRPCNTPWRDSERARLPPTWCSSPWRS